MAEGKICTKCGKKNDCEIPCAALGELIKLYDDLRTEEKIEVIRNLRKELSLVDYEVADDLKILGEKVIAAIPELSLINDLSVKIGYVRSYEPKRDKGKTVYADCRKVKSTYTAYLPFDFIITFYEPNIYYFTDNQKKVLMLHELKHIGIGERGLRTEPHDVEDFESILNRFGVRWNDFGQDVEDILAGGDGETKGNKMETKSKASSNGRTPSKSRRSKNKNG